LIPFQECLASLSANSFPSIPTWLGIHSKITFIPILFSAIFLALNWIQDFKPLNTVIFVDSLSALQAIKGSIYKVKNYIIYDIYNIFTSLNSSGITNAQPFVLF
jgi:hypothetical protein